MTESAKSQSRRSFLRTVAMGAIVGTAGTLFTNTYLNSEDCIGDGKCKKCLALKGCGLPLASEYKAQRPELNENHLHKGHSHAKEVRHG